MADKRLQEKIALIARLENWLAETVAYLEKNRDLYEKKKSRLNALVQQRKVMRVGSPSSDEEKLRKQCDQYEGHRASWLYYVQEIEKQKSNLEAMKRRRKKKKEELSEKEIVKFATQLGYAVEPSKPKRTKKTVKNEPKRQWSLTRLWWTYGATRVRPMLLQLVLNKRQQNEGSQAN